MKFKAQKNWLRAAAFVMGVSSVMNLTKDAIDDYSELQNSNKQTTQSDNSGLTGALVGAISIGSLIYSNQSDPNKKEAPSSPGFISFSITWPNYEYSMNQDALSSYYFTNQRDKFIFLWNAELRRNGITGIEIHDMDIKTEGKDFIVSAKTKDSDKDTPFIQLLENSKAFFTEKLQRITDEFSHSKNLQMAITNALQKQIKESLNLDNLG